MRSDKEIIAALGGYSNLAEELGEKPETTKKWSRRGIPWDKRGRIATLADKHAIKLPADFFIRRRSPEAA
jgi:hypothetical protein